MTKTLTVMAARSNGREQKASALSRVGRCVSMRATLPERARTMLDEANDRTTSTFVAATSDTEEEVVDAEERTYLRLVCRLRPQVAAASYPHDRPAR